MRAVFTSLLVALALFVAVPSTANAQSSGGGISGEATAGDTVVVSGVDTGFHREIKIKKDGKYMLRRVPTGTYHVEVLDKDGNTQMKRDVQVLVGSTARVQ